MRATVAFSLITPAVSIVVQLKNQPRATIGVSLGTASAIAVKTALAIPVEIRAHAAQ